MFDLGRWRPRQPRGAAFTQNTRLERGRAEGFADAGRRPDRRSGAPVDCLGFLPGRSPGEKNLPWRPGEVQTASREARGVRRESQDRVCARGEPGPADWIPRDLDLGTADTREAS